MRMALILKYLEETQKKKMVTNILQKMKTMK